MDFDFSAIEFSSWTVAALIVAGSTLVMLMIKRIIIGRLEKITSRTSMHFDTLMVHAINTPLTLVIILLNLLILDALFIYVEFDGFELAKFNDIATKILAILAIILFIDSFCLGLLRYHSQKSELLKNSQGIATGLTRGLIFGIGILITLGTLGISITPIIASLGITSLAVALALQPTLENFFSGVQLVVDKPIRVGDFIELDSGEQGFVEKIGWRSTWIRMLPNNTVIMPNSVLSQSKIINYYYPEKELSVPVEVGVHYSSDLERVEEVTLEVARHILRTHKWGVPDYETFIVYHTFDNSSINFTVMLRAQEYFNRFFIRSEFIKALHKRYAEEGIVIPYPIRAINTTQESPEFHVQSKPS